MVTAILITKLVTAIPPLGQTGCEIGWAISPSIRDWMGYLTFRMMQCLGVGFHGYLTFRIMPCLGFGFHGYLTFRTWHPQH